jgi:hypothetical protein
MTLPIYGSAKESSGPSESSGSDPSDPSGGGGESSSSDPSSSAENPFGTLEVRLTNGDWGFFSRLYFIQADEDRGEAANDDDELYITGPFAITDGVRYLVDLATALDDGAITSMAQFTVFAEWDSSDPTADDSLDIQVLYGEVDEIKSSNLIFNPFKPDPPANAQVATIDVEADGTVDFLISP